MGPRAAVGCVHNVDHFDGWVQVIDICCAARSFEVRWMFRTDRPGNGGSEKRLSQYKLLSMDVRERDAAVRRVETVARVLRMSMSRFLQPMHFQTNHAEREIVITLLKNVPLAFLERPAEQLAALVEALCRARICLALRDNREPPTLDVTFVFDYGPLAGRTLTVTSYVYLSTVKRIAYELFVYGNPRKLSHAMVYDFVKQLNRDLRWQGYPDDRRASRNSARAVVFGLPVRWPDWLME